MHDLFMITCKFFLQIGLVKMSKLSDSALQITVVVFQIIKPGKDYNLNKTHCFWFLKKSCMKEMFV